MASIQSCLGFCCRALLCTRGPAPGLPLPEGRRAKVQSNSNNNINNNNNNNNNNSKSNINNNHSGREVVLAAGSVLSASLLRSGRRCSGSRARKLRAVPTTNNTTNNTTAASAAAAATAAAATAAAASSAAAAAVAAAAATTTPTTTTTTTTATTIVAVPPLLDALRAFERLAGRQLQNVFLDGNFAPVTDEVTAKDLQVIAGAIPADFPDGLLVRNGPNPRFPPDSVEAPLLGRTAHHWFEGDAMLHAVRIQGGRCSYRNRYIRTPDFQREEAAGQSLFRGIVDTTSLASVVNPLLNLAAFGSAFKDSANTSVVYHGGRLLALVEGQTMPAEISLDDLGWSGNYQFGRKEPLPSFTAHPKVDPVTGEMIFAAYCAVDPPVHVGVVGPDGNLKHWSTVKSAERKTLMHDCAITERFTLILDFPLTIDVARGLKGGKMLDFEDAPSRIGVMPRFGSDVLRWFSFSPGYAFHMLNAFESGDEVVLRGCRADIVTLTQPWREGQLDRVASVGECFQEGSPKKIRLHEWRMNLVSGSCSDRDLGPPAFMDFPTVSPKVVGRENEFGYFALFAERPSLRAGVGVSASLRKYRFNNNNNNNNNNFSAGEVGFEEHDYGPGVSGQEGIFVPRPGGEQEDDGWLLVFTFDEAAAASGGHHSELRIIDARDFSGPPAARIALPQRVPYGFHGTFVPL